jgi:hypothetical protein
MLLQQRQFRSLSAGPGDVPAAVAEAGLTTDERLTGAKRVAGWAVHGRLSDPLPAVPDEIADRHDVVVPRWERPNRHWRGRQCGGLAPVAVAARSIPAGATLRRRRRDVGFGVGHVALTVDYYLPGLAGNSVRIGDAGGCADQCGNRKPGANRR